MTTKIVDVINTTNETISFERLEWVLHSSSIAPHSSAKVDVHVTWCVTLDDFYAGKLIRVNLLTSKKYIYLWERHGIIYCGKEWSTGAAAIPGDSIAGVDKRLYVTPSGIHMQKAGGFFDSISDSDENIKITGPAAEFCSDTGVGKDELSATSSGWCRIYVRRASAMGAGHTAFAYSRPDGKWTVGGVENPKGLPITNPGETGLWSRTVEAHEVNDYFTRKHPMKYPYDAYKAQYVDTINFHAAQQRLAHWYQEPYSLIGKNCMDATVDILAAFGASLPKKKTRPNDWYNSIGHPSQGVMSLPAPGTAEVGLFNEAPKALTQELLEIQQLENTHRTLTIATPDTNAPVTKGSWFNSAAMPIASLPWPDAKTARGWSVTKLAGRFPAGTYLFLNLFSGINVTVPKKKLSEAQAGPSPEIWEWVPVMTLVMNFLSFIGSAMVGVAKAWSEFSNWYSDTYSDGSPKHPDNPGETKDNARGDHMSPDEQDSAKRQVPAELKPNKPTEDTSNAQHTAKKDVVSFVKTTDGRLVSNQLSRGLQIVLQYEDGTTYWLETNKRVRTQMNLPTLDVPIVIPNVEKVTHIYTGWYEDPADYAKGYVSAGDMHGVLDFWQYRG